MVELAVQTYRFKWLLCLWAALVTLSVFFSISIWTSEEVFYRLIVVPLITLLIGTSLIRAAIDKRRDRVFSIVSVLIVFWALSAVLVANYSELRSNSRWLLWSRDYKAEVLAQPNSVNGELKHIEWDGWGFPGAGDTNLYLVFDPTDGLSKAATTHQPGKFNGLPREVARVRRLEDHWYAVLFYTDQWWGRQIAD